ncbi:MAG: hypothetical protein OEW15_03680 [Nitrospirota bacterium]|nr:hypothetical protein [Nitrospirota bacterium]
MIRAILLFILFAVLYQAVKTVFRAAVRAAQDPSDTGRLPGEEMVLDPQCRTYVVKGRAVIRRISGAPTHFCSTHCADEYERLRRR